MTAASTDGIYPPLREEPDELGSLRRGIARAVSSRAAKLEQLVGLEEPNSQFRDDLSEAILLCVLTHKFRPKRRSETRKQLEALKKKPPLLRKLIVDWFRGFGKHQASTPL